MKSQFERGQFLAMLAIAAALPLSLLAAAEGSFDRTLKVTGAVELEVKTGSGSISVHNGDAGAVQIHGRIHARSDWRGGLDAEDKVRRLETNPPIEQSGNVIRIGRIDDEELRRNVSISYEIVTPVETRLASQTGSGSQTVEGIHGPVSAGTGSGSITINNISNEVRASTGSGDVRMDVIKGRVSAHTGSGGIRGAGIAGPLQAETGSGNVRLEQTASGNVEVRTGSGSVEVAGVRGSLRAHTGSGNITAQGEPTGDWRLDAGSGSVTVRLPSQAGFDLRAHTGSGRVEVGHPVTVQGTISPRRIEGKVRNGGALLDVSTGSGNIHIE
ncbi:MAG: DUF4097 family beta strand repeat protein [Acidobacteria bacterium]|nr:DUF4097 family beta strand repeat protein [Acidobacteriota bacterium]